MLLSLALVNIVASKLDRMPWRCLLYLQCEEKTSQRRNEVVYEDFKRLIYVVISKTRGRSKWIGGIQRLNRHPGRGRALKRPCRRSVQDELLFATAPEPGLFSAANYRSKIVDADHTLCRAHKASGLTKTGSCLYRRHIFLAAHHIPHSYMPVPDFHYNRSHTWNTH